ncbi:MAG: MFS transporter [Coriobacteriia bacterium]|nr:MFS transporter [Coriobacteriia bacterium]
MVNDNTKKFTFSNAVKVIIIFGLVSLFGDIVYEGARSASGQYLQLLGANATAVGIIVGLGEFLAYSLRLLAGTASDRTQKYWLFIFLGYGMLIVIPMMGLTTSWQFVVVLMMCERIGKALRNPSKDTILSHVAEGQVGTGFAFGLQEALDQLGAFSGPMVFSVVFMLTGKQGAPEYQKGFLFMIFPFILLMLIVYLAFRSVTKNNLMEVKETAHTESDKLAKVFWIYTVFTFFSLLGFAQFALIGYHLKAQAVMPDAQITIMYSVTMAVDAVIALAIGFIYDRVKKKSGNKQSGLLTLLFIPFATAAIPFFSLSSSVPLVIIGLVSYGAVMGAHETIMRSAIADITPLRKRGTGYGIFNTAYGVALLIGSSLFGFLYDNFSVGTIQIVVLVAEIAAVVVFFIMRSQIKKDAEAASA